ncbi:trigger factor-like [Anastrepha ludens]|uniref:trigger factor-like n=1 Tax=Anastrepha ludens TaxID=28586 RepID=UPI0023AF5FCA|nr:trigger factor-like [Anastrepha ludens]
MATQTPPSRRHQPCMQVDSAEDGDDDDDDDDDENDDNNSKDDENDNLIDSDADCEAAGVGGDGGCKPHASTSDGAKAHDRHADRAAKYSSI